MSARERFDVWIKAQPFCVGYNGGCDGDLPGIVHHEECPMSKVDGSAGHTSMLTFSDVWLAAWQAREAECEGLRSALTVIRKGLKCDTGGDPGEYWSARKWLREHNSYEENLQGLAVLLEVCDVALKFAAESALSARRQAKL